MQILVDTRQKEQKHENIDNYFKENGITVISKKLDIGDYILSEDAKVAVDTKQDLYEICCDLFSLKEKPIFQRACKRAKEAGVKLYILIEQKFDKQKLLAWKSKKNKEGKLITKATGKHIYSRMEIYSLMFGIKWRFCRKVDTGKKILELLGVDKND